MKILVASDKFKGSLTAPEACAAIAAGLREGLGSTEVEIRSLPIADGGDGIADTLLAACGGRWVECDVTGPLGDPVKAGYTLLDGGEVAVIEMAKASGLVLVADRTPDPLRASTFGTGSLIAHATAAGVREIVLGIGGSATNDGGTGMAEALGFRFEEEDGTVVTGLPSGLERVARLVPPDKTTFPRVVVACDVTNPLLGERGCTRIYGPQKGITPETFAHHEERLARLVALVALVALVGEDGEAAAAVPGSGAAGGLGFGAIVFLGATLVPGFDLVAEKLGLSEAIRDADLVITGEGRLDTQSLQGKGPHGVARLARRFGKRTAAFCGSLERRELEEEFGPVTEIGDPDRSLEENLAAGADLLRDAAKRFALRGLIGLP